MDQPESARFVSRLTKDTVALVLAGGRGSRLKQMTDWRAKPAVPFGGKFRIIDFPLSNCLNSGIRRMGVLTQYKSHSLVRHIQQAWGFMRLELNEFVELLPASQRTQEGWYAGTADAVYQNIDILRNHGPEYILILAGDHIYKMDYGNMIADHVEAGADMTIGCLQVPLDEAKAFGVMSVDAEHRIVEFNEKPENPDSMPGKEGIALASMGIYVFNAKFLYEQLIKDADTPNSTHDFGHDIIPSLIEKYKVIAHPYKDVQGNDPGYWRDVGTVDAFWAANLELIGVSPELNLYDDSWPIWTHQAQLPPAKFVFDDDERRGMAVDAMVSGGCIISGSTVRHSVLFSNVRVNSYSTIDDCVILPDVTIGRNCRLKKVVFDKGCNIPEGTVIEENAAQDAERFHISPEGVVLVTPEMLGQDYRHVR
jgi:glucose-1-phosphate adenylyltransferase